MLNFTVLGRIPSMKNSREVFLNTKTGQRHWVINKKTKKVMDQIARQAALARAEFWNDLPLPAKTCFHVQVVAYISNFTAPDGDGILNTIMDALQGVLYDNDRYCMYQSIRRVVTDGPECVMITVSMP